MSLAIATTLFLIRFFITFPLMREVDFDLTKKETIDIEKDDDGNEEDRSEKEHTAAVTGSTKPLSGLLQNPMTAPSEGLRTPLLSGSSPGGVTMSRQQSVKLLSASPGGVEMKKMAPLTRPIIGKRGVERSNQRCPACRQRVLPAGGVATQSRG